MAYAGAPIIGGHSIDDPEPKMGYAVTGIVHPDHIWRNSTARAKDRLYLTKPIGTGVLVKAIKDGIAEPLWEQAAVTMMAELNKDAKEALAAAVRDPSACTDVTGFGLLGHLWEMAQGAGVRMVLWEDAVPLLPGAEQLAQEDRIPAGSRRNWEVAAPHVVMSGHLSARRRLLADAVTSGGLLFTIATSLAPDVEAAFRERGLPLWAIGEVTGGPAGIELA
jgi:selenide,water dikinase